MNKQVSTLAMSSKCWYSTSMVITIHSEPTIVIMLQCALEVYVYTLIHVPIPTKVSWLSQYSICSYLV